MPLRTAARALLFALLVAGCAQRPATVEYNTQGKFPPPPPEKPAIAAVQQVPGSMIVKPGDSVYVIARRYNVSTRALIETNRLTPPYKLLVGQVLRLPRGRVHTVVSGDTLYGISRSYGIDMNALARANRLAPPYLLLVGQRLNVPVISAAATQTATQPATQTATQTATLPVAPSPAPKVDTTAKAPPAPLIPTPPPRSSGRFLWPVQGTILSKFGPKSGGFHNDGINISAPRGAPVYAAEAGVVAYAGNELRGYGNLLLIRHAEGWTTAYAHNETLLVTRGDTVRRGQTVAKVGSSGNVTAPQSHFELRRGTKVVDPLKYLASN